jgi:hypothetical protein
VTRPLTSASPLLASCVHSTRGIRIGSDPIQSAPECKTARCIDRCASGFGLHGGSRKSNLRVDRSTEGRISETCGTNMRRACTSRNQNNPGSAVPIATRTVSRTLRAYGSPGRSGLGSWRRLRTACCNLCVAAEKMRQERRPGAKALRRAEEAKGTYYPAVA